MRALFKVTILTVFSMLAGVLSAQFTQQNYSFSGVFGPAVEFADYDSDGDLDCILTGSTSSSGTGVTKLYQNNGNSGFSQMNIPFLGVFRGSVDWGDYNNDGHPDLIVSGATSGESSVTRLYRNLGNGSFQSIDCGFMGVDYSSVEWADYNLDGWLDLLLAGVNAEGDHSVIYRNNRDGTFTDIEANLCPISYGTASWSDYDNDGDPDILFCGSNHMDVYANLGDGMFENINAGMFPVFYGAAAWGDYDNDQFPDIVCQGYTLSGPITKLYRNNQEGGFQEVPTRLQNCYGGSLTWGDYNSDGKLDLFLTGYFDGNRISKIYRNENWGIFSITGDEFPNISSSWATWTDYNNDGKLDLFLAGFDGNLFHSRLYRNDYPHINTQPSPPIITYNTDSQRFQISGSEDSTTPESGLTYDIRIGTVPGGCDISAPLAHPDGSRMIDKLGRRVIRFIPEEGQIYYAAVQAIDRSFARSAFSSEIAFSVEGEAQICTIGPPLYDYGAVYLDNSIQHSVIVGNPGTGNLYVNSIELVSGTNFSIDPIDTPLILAIGATYSIRVTFCPQSNGILTDSLVIMSNAVNSPLLQIPLLGCGISSPPAPVQDITLEMIGNDAHLSWSPVTETTTGDPIEVSRYVIFFNQNSDEEHFWYLANTTDHSYVHEDVGLFSPSWFYRIVAVVLYSRADELWMDHLERGTKPFVLKDFPALRFKKGSELLRKGLPTTHLKK